MNSSVEFSMIILVDCEVVIGNAKIVQAYQVQFFFFPPLLVFCPVISFLMANREGNWKRTDHRRITVYVPNCWSLLFKYMIYWSFLVCRRMLACQMVQ